MSDPGNELEPGDLVQLVQVLADKRAELGAALEQGRQSNADYFRKVAENAARRALEYGAADEQAQTSEQDAEEHAILDLPKRYAWASFGHPTLMSDAVRSPKALDRAAAHRMDPRLVFIGGSGTGKTTLAVAMLRARWLTQMTRYRPRFVQCFRLGYARAAARLGDEPALVETCLTWPGVILLDDLGNPNRDPPATAIPDVILARHDAELPTWLTTWMSPTEVENRYGAGVARRVFEQADIIDCGATS
jgi:hypothetical protein